MTTGQTQLGRLKAYLGKHKFARAFELVAAGIDRKTIQRALLNGDIRKAGYGLYSAVDAHFEYNMSFAGVTKLSPNAVICGHSALFFHELTDQIPRQIFFALRKGDWKNNISYPPTQISTFGEPYYSEGIEMHEICGITVKVYSIAKSICDAFRLSKLVNRSIAIESLITAVRFNKLSPAELADSAEKFGVLATIEPYLEVLISSG